MTNREREIEELAQHISASIDRHGLGLQESEIDLIAIDIYDRGCRKVGDAVVVTKEDYSDLLIAQRNWEFGKDIIKTQSEKIDKAEQAKWRLAKALAESKTKTAEEVRKKTAREILSLCLSDEYIAFFEEGIIREIAEKYGVEVKEIRKEVFNKIISLIQEKRNSLMVTTRDIEVKAQCKAYADMEIAVRELAKEYGVEVENE